MASQKQNAGDSSTNIQAESITIHQGVSLEAVRQVALDIFRANFYELAGEAKDIAQRRAEEITEDFLRKLEQENASGNTRCSPYKRNMHAVAIRNWGIY